MQAAEHAHSFVVDFCLQTSSTVVEVLWCLSPFRSLPSRHHTLVVDAGKISNSCRSQSLRCCDAYHRFDLCRPDIIHWLLTQVRYQTVAVHCRWYRSLWASTTLAVESPTDLFVASHWLERSSSRFSVTFLVFSWADHSTSQVLTTSHVVLFQLLLKACFKKPPYSSDLFWLVHGHDITCRG